MVPSLTPRRHLAETGSTNKDAQAAFDGGQHDACWFTADQQTAGVGRRGRAWVHDPQNFAGSLLWPIPPDAIRRPALFSFLAALSVHAALVASGVADDKIGLKWPNDVLLEGQKVAGILPQLVNNGPHQAVIIGIGVNLAAAPTGPDFTAIAARPFLRTVPTPTVFWQRLDRAFCDLWGRSTAEGFDAIRTSWLHKAEGVGQPITARLQDRTLAGIFAGIGQDGELLLDQDGAITPVLAADIFLGPAPANHKDD